MLTQARLKEILSYDPETGLFTWLLRKAKKTKIGGIAGGIDGYGYVGIELDGKTYRAHRLAFLYVNGKFSKDDVDHINHIRSDNRFTNLREATTMENCRNRKMQSNNTSGFKGVNYNKQQGKWTANIRISKKLKHLGYFETKEAANLVRKKAEKEFFGDFMAIL